LNLTNPLKFTDHQLNPTDFSQVTYAISNSQDGRCMIWEQDQVIENQCAEQNRKHDPIAFVWLPLTFEDEIIRTQQCFS
jgi:hypothetical protein